MPKAPWSKSQVDALNRSQKSGYFHPFTCGNDKCRCDLIATANGWICPQCDYTQDWCNESQCDGSMDKMIEAMKDHPLMGDKKE